MSTNITKNTYIIVYIKNGSIETVALDYFEV